MNEIYLPYSSSIEIEESTCVENIAGIPPVYVKSYVSWDVVLGFDRIYFVLDVWK